jgi:hypothetical protein
MGQERVTDGHFHLSRLIRVVHQDQQALRVLARLGLVLLKVAKVDEGPVVAKDVEILTTP